MNDFNQQIVDEFRANEGKVGGGFDGAPMLILHTTGAKSGQPRVNPLVYQADGENIAIFASKGGAPAHPHWYLNLAAHPDAEIEIGSQRRKVRARVAEGEERERIWAKQKDVMPGFAEYEEKAAGREIPVIILDPAR